MVFTFYLNQLCSSDHILKSANHSDRQLRLERVSLSCLFHLLLMIELPDLQQIRSYIAFNTDLDRPSFSKQNFESGLNCHHTAKGIAQLEGLALNKRPPKIMKKAHLLQTPKISLQLFIDLLTIMMIKKTEIHWTYTLEKQKRQFKP